MFPFSIAKKLPVYVYEKVKFSNLSGEIVIDAPIKRGMIGIGQRYEKTTRTIGLGEWVIKGKIICRGRVQFGKDVFVYVGKDGVLQLEDMCGMATLGKLICTNRITLNHYTRIGSECQVIDTDFHPMIDTLTGERFPMSAPVVLGAFNYVSRWTTVLKGTITPDYCTIASNTLCNKDYREFGTHILIGGIPAKLLREHISRDWEAEIPGFEAHLAPKW